MGFEEDRLSVRVFRWLQALIPVVFMMLLLAASLAGKPALWLIYEKPDLFLIGIYYWALFAPAALPLWLIFVTGLCVDMVELYPLGAHALIYCGVYKAMQAQRIYLIHQPFWILWGIFAFVYGVTSLLEGLAYAGTAAFTIALAQSQWQGFILTVLILPAAYTVLHAVHRLYVLEPSSPLARKRRNIIVKRQGYKRARQRIRV